MFFRTYKPNHRIVVKDLKTGDVKFDISDDIISLTTNKAYGRASGAWQMILTWKLVNGQRYDELIQTDDVVTIELDSGSGLGFVPVMIGLVDRASQTFTAAGNHPQRQVKISGQDLGKLLSKHDIGWDVSGAQIQTALSIQGQGDGAGETTIAQNYLARITLQAGTAKSIITQLMDLFLKQLDSSLNWNFDLNCSTDDDWEIWDQALQYIRGTTAWSAMKCYAHEPWNMLHADTVDLTKFQVVLERNPIDDQGMLSRTAARTHTITDGEIVSEDIGKSDCERINLLCYWPTMYQVAVGGSIDIVMAHPDLTWFDEDEIKLHGYCSKVIPDNFNAPDVKTPNDICGSDKLAALAVPRAETFWNWHSMNHELDSGTFVIHGDPQMKTGDMLLVKQGMTDTYKEFLIEQVAHTYAVWPQPMFTTTLLVTRGQIHG